MSLVKNYLNLSDEDRKVMRRNFIHWIKYEPEEDVWEYFDYFDFSLLDETNKQSLVALAVVVGHSLQKRFNKIPDWCHDPRLVMEKAYKSRGYQDSWFFMPVQAFLRHNYFTDPGSLDVV